MSGYAQPVPLPPAGGVRGGQFQPRDTSRARQLRNEATPSERALWKALRNRQISGHKFSRQMPVGPYFADFLCREAKLIVELDGYSHDLRQAHDERRDAFLRVKGYRTVRFSNEDVLTNIEGVVAAIALALDEAGPPPAPPASGRGEDITLAPDKDRSVG